MDEEPSSYLYRFYDRAERLLYVGITDHLISRLNAHQRFAPWWDQVALSTIEFLPTRREAQLGEAHAIMVEGPVYNIARPARQWMAQQLASGREPVESLLVVLEEAQRLRVTVEQQGRELEAARQTALQLHSALHAAEHDWRGAMEADHRDQPDPEWAWAEDDERANIAPDDPRIRRGSPELHQQMRQMLLDAAADDVESQQLLASAGLYESDDSEPPILEYPDR